MSNTDFRYFPYIIRDIVAAVRAEYDPTNGLLPYYEFGTYLELTKQLSIKGQIDAGKYPLVWLVWEAPETVQDWTEKMTYNVSPRLFICNFTDPNYSSVERYDANFIGVLFPIFELFKEQLNFNKFVSSSTAFNFQLGEHLHWGSTLNFDKKQNVMFDALDAIEIKFSSLEINKIC